MDLWELFSINLRWWGLLFDTISHCHIASAASLGGEQNTGYCIWMAFSWRVLYLLRYWPSCWGSGDERVSP
jgi:hypothetical protein